MQVPPACSPSLGRNRLRASLARPKHFQDGNALRVFCGAFSRALHGALDVFQEVIHLGQAPG